MTFRNDLEIESPSVRGNGQDIRVFVPTSGIPIVIAHTLRRVPVSFQIIDKDASCDAYRQSWDRQKIILVFTASNVNAVVRVE